MRILFVTALAGVAAFATAAAAQPAHGDHRDSATICLDTLGVTHPATCKSMSATRLAQKPDICMCLGNWQTVKTPWCKAGERPPADSAEFDRARVDYANKHGSSLFGFSYNGQRACQPIPQNGQ